MGKLVVNEIGKLIEGGSGQRDAIHVAIAPVTAAMKLARRSPE